MDWDLSNLNPQRIIGVIEVIRLLKKKDATNEGIEL